MIGDVGRYGRNNDNLVDSKVALGLGHWGAMIPEMDRLDKSKGANIRRDHFRE